MPTTNEKATRLKNLIHAKELLVMPGVYDPLSARIVQEAGYESAQCSGFAMTLARIGMPDYSFLSFSDMIDASRTIAESVDIPIMADGDTGFGNAVNAWHTVKAFERAGCAGINIEDQVFPKRCGHLEGKSLLPLDEAVAKIRACSEARVSPDFVINARTDALAVGGIDEVIRRGNAYMAAGATMIFIDGMTSRDLATQAVKGIRGPVAINVVEGGKSQMDFSFDDMQAIGIARVSLPVTLMLASIQAMRTALAGVKRRGGASTEGLAPFKDLQTLAGFPEIFELEQRFMGDLLAPKVAKAA